MNYPVALTPYLNNRSFFYHTDIENCELVQLPPRESVKALINGRVQAGVVPVASLAHLGDQFELLGDFGIASEGPVQSVLFFSKIPFELFTPTNTIKLTSESATSIKLLGLLFGYQHGFDNLPQTASDQDVPDGELLIGDRALECLQSGLDLYVMDLSSQWMQCQQLPFVFARWVINKDAPAKFHTELKRWLTAFVENETNLHRITAEREARQFRMTYGQVMGYLQGIKTRIGEREHTGQSLFLSELKKHSPAFNQLNNQLRKQCA